jgi:hypothetical protein
VKILHVTGHSIVCRTPFRIACYWGRYTEHSGKGACIGRDGGWRYQESLNPYGCLCTRGHEEELRQMVREADVIHCHDDYYPTALWPGKGKVLVFQAHIGSIPKNYFIPGRHRYDRRVRHACITNGYGRVFDEEERRAKVKWGRLPDILDINHPILTPRPDLRPPYPPDGPLRVVFTHSNSHGLGGRINAKAPVETKALLRGIPGVRVKFITGVSFEEAMAEKQSAHVVLDEVFSPFTHLSSLEGPAVGAPVLVNFDDYTSHELCDYLGAPRESIPWVRVTPKTLRSELERLRDHPDEAREIGRKSREWMLRWYSPAALLRRYLEFYGRG